MAGKDLDGAVRLLHARTVTEMCLLLKSVVLKDSYERFCETLLAPRKVDGAHGEWL